MRAIKHLISLYVFTFSREEILQNNRINNSKIHTCRDDPAAMRTSDASTMRYVSSTRGRGILSPKNTTVGCLFE